MENQNFIIDTLKDIKDDIRHIRNNSIPHVHHRIDEIILKMTSKSNGGIDYRPLYYVIGVLVVGLVALATGKVIKLF